MNEKIETWQKINDICAYIVHKYGKLPVSIDPNWMGKAINIKYSFGFSYPDETFISDLVSTFSNKGALVVAEKAQVDEFTINYLTIKIEK